MPADLDLSVTAGQRQQQHRADYGPAGTQFQRPQPVVLRLLGIEGDDALQARAHRLDGCRPARRGEPARDLVPAVDGKRVFRVVGCPVAGDQALRREMLHQLIVALPAWPPVRSAGCRKF
jgi:hypothetical protein